MKSVILRETGSENCNVLGKNPMIIVGGPRYEAELQVVGDGKTRPTEFLVEKVLSKRRRNGKTEVLVRWMGLPSKFDSYIDEAVVSQYFPNH
jgi:hypothetical protein